MRFFGVFLRVALGFIPALTQTVHFSDGRSQNRLWLLKGACPNAFLQKLTTQERETIKRTMVEDDSRTSEDTALSIAVEHGDPCRIRVFARRPHALVLRVMSEGKFSERDLRCISHSAADEIWVPTRFHVEQLRSQLGHALSAGIYILPEIVPSHFFSPRMDSCEDDGSDADQRGKRGQPFTFLSVFKFEYRKGWDVLLSAYWSAFDVFDDVLLTLKSFVPHWEVVDGRDSVLSWLEWYAKKAFKKSLQELPPVRVIEDEVSREAMRSLYGNSDCFVLPSRGEGWGLPVVEAMLMELPVIVTNYSGTTAYLRNDSSYPLSWTAVSDSGLCQPDVAHLKYLMRQVYDDPESAKNVASERART